MKLQSPCHPVRKLVLLSCVLCTGPAVQAQEVFTITGPVSWAGTQDTITWAESSYYDGTFEARITHDPATPLHSSYSSDYGYVSHGAEWQDAISSIEYTVFDPDGNVRFSATVLPDFTPGGEDNPYSPDMNRVMKYASDLRSYGFEAPFSTQQYWDVSNDDGADLRSYAQAAYVRTWAGSTDDLDDFVARLAQYPQPEEGADWPQTQFSGYHSANSFMKAVWGAIATTDAAVDVDGDGVSDNLDACPASDLAATIVIGRINTRVANTLLDSGCTLKDLISIGIDMDASHGSNNSSVAQILNGLVKEGYISGKSRGAIQSAMARSR